MPIEEKFMKKHSTLSGKSGAGKFPGKSGITESLDKKPVEATDHDIAPVVGLGMSCEGPAYTVLLTGEFKQLKELKKALEEQIRAQQDKIKTLETQSRIREEDLNKAIASAIDDNLTLNAAKEQLNKELQNLRDSQETLQERLARADQAEEDLQRSRKALDQKTEDAKRAQAKIAELKLQIEAQDKDLSLQRHDHETGTLVLTNEVNNLKENKKNLEEELKRQEGLLQDLQKENAEQDLRFRTSVESFRESIDVLNKDNQELSEQLEKLAEFIEEKDQQIADLCTQLSNNNEKLDNKEQELTQLTVKSSELADKAKKLESEIKALESHKNEEQEAKKETEKKLRGLQKDLSETDKQRGDLEAKTNNLAETVGKLRKQLESTQKELVSKVEEAKREAAVMKITRETSRAEGLLDLEFKTEQRMRAIKSKRAQELEQQKHAKEMELNAKFGAIENARTVNKKLVEPFKVSLKGHLESQYRLAREIKELESRSKQLESRLKSISLAAGDKNIEALTKSLSQFVSSAFKQIMQDIAGKRQELQECQNSIVAQGDAIIIALQKHACDSVQAQAELDNIIQEINNGIANWESTCTFIGNAYSAAAVAASAITQCPSGLAEYIASLSARLVPEDPSRGIEILGSKALECLGDLTTAVNDASSSVASSASNILSTGIQATADAVSWLGSLFYEEPKKPDELQTRLEAPLNSPPTAPLNSPPTAPLNSPPTAEPFTEFEDKEIQEAMNAVRAEENRLIASFKEYNNAEIATANAMIAQEALRGVFAKYSNDLMTQASSAENIWLYEAFLQLVTQLKGMTSDDAQLENIKNFAEQLQKLDLLSNILQRINDQLVDKEKKQELLKTIEKKQEQLKKMNLNITTNAQEDIKSLEQQTTKLVNCAGKAFLDIYVTRSAPDSEAASLSSLSPSEYVKQLLGADYLEALDTNLWKACGKNEVELNLGKEEREKEKKGLRADTELERKLAALTESSGELALPDPPVSVAERHVDKDEDRSDADKCEDRSDADNNSKKPVLTV
ncbi:hypothetical protein RLOatenuis_7790 [Rickettsiales bacterium]|nr:hypothetical protein RLOatenuis_7790 [Rickettsiales bacterium]